MRITYLAAVCAALVLAGCKKPAEVTTQSADGTYKTTINGKEGQVTVEGNKEDGTSKLTTTDEKGNVSTFETKSGVDLVAYGLEVYPGAKPKEDKNSSAEVKSDKGVMVTATLLTTDAPEKVSEFYKGLLTKPTETKMEDMAHVSGKTKDGADAIITANYDKEKKETTIAILITKNN